MAGYAHFALQKLRILPSVFLAMGEEERCFVIASIRSYQESEEEKRKEAEAKIND